MHQDNRNDKGIRRDSGRAVPTERQNAYRTANKAPSRIPVKSDGTIAPAVKRPASVNTRKYVRPAVCHGPAILVCIVMVLFIIAQFLLKTEAFTQQNPYIALVVVQFIVFILPCAFISAFGNRKMNGGLSQYNFRLFSPKLLGFIFSSLAVMLFGNMVIKYLGYMLFGAVGSSTVIYEHDNIFALIAATVLVPAITEEILLRGVVFTEYEKRGVGPVGAVAGSAVMFAFIHFDFKDFIPYLFAGIILAVVLHVTRSLLAPIIVHLLNNTICLFTDTFLKRVSKESISSFFVFFLLTVLLLLSLFAFFESLEWICSSRADKKFNNENNRDEDAHLRMVPANTKISYVFSAVFLTPAFIVIIALYIAEMLIFR